MKVFSVKKFQEDCKNNGSSVNSIMSSVKSWAGKCNGLTAEEMLELGCHTHPDWMVEKEELEEEEK